jgi:RNA polymerase sigma-70 factor (ECF subfamily)
MNAEMTVNVDKVKIFEEELFPHADALKGFAMMLTKNEADAEDLVQETLIKAFKNIESYRPGTNAKAWLFQITKNGFINDYRKKSIRPSTVDFDQINIVRDEEDNTPYDGYYDLRVEMFQDMMGDEITSAIEQIPERFSIPVLLCDIEEFSYEEISSILDVPLGTVRSRLYRGRNLLKDILNEYAKSQGYEDKRS